MGILLPDLLGMHTMESICALSSWGDLLSPLEVGDAPYDWATIGLDGNVYRFVKRRSEQDWQSWLSAINPLGIGNPGRNRDGTLRFQPPIVVDIRYRAGAVLRPLTGEDDIGVFEHEDNVDDVIYAVNEDTGLVIFEVGTEADEEGKLSFLWCHNKEFPLEGYTPKWLEAVDPDPPVEIPGKKKHAERLMKVGGGRHFRTPIGARRTPIGARAK